jgi:hypothetical protein
MRIAAMIALGVGLAACAFEPGTLDDPGASGDDGSGSDSGAGSGGSGSGSGSSTVARTCAFPDPDLRLCIEFEDRVFAPSATDASTAQLDAATTNISEVSHDGRYAAGMIVASQIAVPESTKLDLMSSLTIEMWVWPGWNQFANLLVNANQYGVQLASDGRIGCKLPAASVWSDSERTAQNQQWTHVACTYSAGGNLTVYVNGKQAGASASSNPGLNGLGNQGTKIGGGYGGGIDDIRIYARALSSQDVCTHAGHASCADE